MSEASACSRERLAERLDAVWVDRQAGSCSVPAESLEMLRAGRERAVQVEAPDGAPGAFPPVLGFRDQDHRAAETLHEARRDDADHADVPVRLCEHVPAPPPLARWQGLDQRGRLAEDPVLHPLPVPVQLLELPGELPSLLRVLGQDQLESGVGTPEPARRVDPRSEPETDGAGVDGGRIDARDPHELAQTRPAGARENPQARRGEAAVLVDERHDVRDRRERDEIEVLLERGVLCTEQRLCELVHDPGPAELRERVGGGPRSHDRAVGKRLRRPVMVGHDHLEAERDRLRDLLHRGDPAVDGENQPDSLAGHAGERVAGDAVALLEAARKVPDDVRAQLAQHQDCERGCADPVDVVVAVDADAGSGVDCSADALDGHGHVAEQERVVAGKLGVEEAAGSLRVVVAAADEDRRRDLAEVELIRQRGRCRCVDSLDRPHARHPNDGTEAAGRSCAQARNPRVGIPGAR